MSEISFERETTEARRVWNQKAVPVILRRTGKGENLRVRLPFSDSNRIWLAQVGKSALVWINAKQYWEIPKSWFNQFVDLALKKFGRLYVIQPYVEHEVCAPACRDAKGHECQCSCMGAHHGIGDGSGWFDISETFTIRFGQKRLAWRLMQNRKFGAQ